MDFRRCLLTGMGTVIAVSTVVVVVLGIVLGSVFASPLRQFPTSSVTIISDPPPPNLPGQFSERTLLQPNPLDPSSAWRQPTFDDSGWQDSYPAAISGWGAPVDGSDFIWGGARGTDVGGRYEIPSAPAPQFLFLRKNFCIPINADLSTVQAATSLQIQVAADPGRAAVSYNEDDLAILPGQGGTVQSLDVASSVASFRRLGRNTLAMSVQDDVDDLYAAVAYYLELSYSIDPGAITISANPPVSTTPGAFVTFSQGGTGPGGDAPYTLNWDFGDGTTGPNPHAYAVAGTYTVTLVVADSFGCPSAPVSIQYIVAEPATPTPTSTPTNTPTTTNTAVPAPTNTPRPANTSSPSQPQATDTPVPTFTPTPILTLLLPETGDVGWSPGVNYVCLAVGILLVVGYFYRRKKRQRVKSS
jgi:hypothetical protein